MIVQAQASSATSASTPSVSDPARNAVDTFVSTGRLDISALTAAEPGAVTSAAATLTPLEQGQFQGALLGAGLGNLLGDTVGATLSTVENTADAAVTTPSEKQAEEIEQVRQDRTLFELRAQAELELVLVPYEKLDRPPASLAHVVSVASPKDGDPARQKPLA